MSERVWKTATEKYRALNLDIARDGSPIQDFRQSRIGPQPCETNGGENIPKDSERQGLLLRAVSLVIDVVRLMVELLR